MGEQEGWLQPPNGLLPNEGGSVMRVLDTERWEKAERRTAELIACIQPNELSEQRRNAVAVFVQNLIMRCFPCHVFTFGSVPLKTYLPDGDIDLTAFSNDQNLKDTWAHQVRDALENEEKNENAEFRVKEVQYIQAEVKLIKCLVENIVVDISFNQLGGLCTLCFLDEVDNLINQNHLFKRSIILIKAWCYYESRVLGAHHGLISTYALETLVLYIFNVFNNSFAGPLEVLYRFLEFFSKFDWNNFCVSLWGPVPISSLPDATVEAPRKDGGDLLLNKLFLEACSLAYSVSPPQEHQGHPFVSKHLNIIDPLRTNNNLGRSVSKGNFYRIRSAFAFGAKSLGRVLECPKEDIYNELNQFFMNTWDRHGSGRRPDVPRSDLYCRRSPSGPISEDLKNKGNSKKDGSLPGCENHGDGVHRLCDTSSRPVNVSVGSSCRNGDVSAARVQDQKRSGSLGTSETSDSVRPVSSFSHGVPTETNHMNFKLDHLVNDVQRRHLFARTRSSPELTDNYGNFSSQQRFNVPESKRSLAVSVTLDNRRGKNLESDNYASHSIRSSNNMASSIRSVSSSQSGDTVASTNSATNSFCNGSDLATMNLKDDIESGVETQGMHQGEQDLGSMTTSSATHGHFGLANVPFNLTPDVLPLRTTPPFLASMGFPPRYLGGMFRADTPFIENPWGANMQFPPGQVSKPPAHYFHKVDLTSCSGEPAEANSENFEIVDTNPEEKEHGYWHEHGGPNGRYDQNHGGFEMHQLEEKQQSTPGNKFGLSPMGNVRSSARMPPKYSKSSRGSREGDYADTSKHQENSGNKVYYEDGRASPRSSSDDLSRRSMKGKAPSEDSWEGPTTKFSNPTGEKRGRKSSTTMVSSTAYGRGNSGSEHSSIQAEGYNKNWNPSSLMVTELSERSTGPQSVPALHDPRPQIVEHELAQTSAPLLLGSRQRVTDDSGAVPFAFYPTGPPVPFVMVPLYNFPSEMGNAEASNRHYNSEEGIVECDSGQNLDSPEVPHQPYISGSMSMNSSAEPEDHRSDILNGDFASHWQNLQFGRFCQNSQIRAPLLYPSPMMAPPVYLQGHYPWDGSGRPISADASLVNQFMSYGPRIVPASPLRPLPNRPAGFYQNYMDEIPKHRSGTGTYLPNPASLRDRYSTSTKRGANRSQHSSHDRSDHADRENNWNTSSKSRTAGRNQNSRQEQMYPSESRAGGPWDPNRHDSSSSFDSRNGPIRGSEASSTDMPYGVYPLTALNPSGMSSNGPNVPPLVMLYPYDHNSPHRPTAEQLEFGSLGRVGFSGSADTSPLSEGTVSGGAFEEQGVNGGSAKQTASDQPSSPHFRR